MTEFKFDRPENTTVGHVRNGFIARMMDYSPPAIAVWLALANRANASLQCWPSVAAIQEDTGMARATTIRAIRELSEAGEITVDSQKGKGAACNHYTLKGSTGNELVQDLNRSTSSGNELALVQDLNRTSSANEPVLVQHLNSNHTNRTRLKNQTKNQTKKARTFKRPSLEEIQGYCLERKNQVDPQRFLDYYESNGWKVGKNAMKDWKAAVRTWERNGFDNGDAGQQSEPLEYRN